MSAAEKIVLKGSPVKMAKVNRVLFSMTVSYNITLTKGARMHLQERILLHTLVERGELG